MRRHAARRALSVGPGRAPAPAAGRAPAPRAPPPRSPAKMYNREFVVGSDEARFFVHNIPSNASEDDVQKAIERVCAVKDVHVRKDMSTGLSRGFGFVTVEAALAEKMQRGIFVLRGKQLLVQSAVKQTLKTAPPQPLSVTKPLNRSMMNATTVEQVLRVFKNEGNKFDPLNIATCLHRCSSLNRSYEPSNLPMLKKLVDQATISITSDSKRWTPRALSSASRGAAHFEADPLFYNAVAVQAQQKLSHFNPLDISNLVWAYAKGGFEAKRLFHMVSAVAVPKISEFSPQNLANTAWAYAKSGFQAQALFDAIAVQVENKVEMFKPTELAAIVWSFSTLDIEKQSMYQTIATKASMDIDLFNAHDLANTVWAYATAGEASLNRFLFDAAAAAATPKLQYFKAQALANTAWAFATAAVPAPVLFSGLAAESLAKIEQFNAQGLNNLIWAFSTLNVTAPTLYQAVALESMKKMKSFNTQALSSTAWAYANAGLGARHEVLLDAVAKEMTKQVSLATSQALAITVWSFATAGRPAPALFSAVAESALTRPQTFSPHSLSNTLWSFATAGVEAPALFHAFSQPSEDKMHTFSASYLTNTAWAYATAKIPAPQLFAAMAAHAPTKWISRNPQLTAKLLWALAETQTEAPELLTSIEISLKKRLKPLQKFSENNLVTVLGALAPKRSQVLFRVAVLRRTHSMPWDEEMPDTKRDPPNSRSTTLQIGPRFLRRRRQRGFVPHLGLPGRRSPRHPLGLRQGGQARLASFPKCRGRGGQARGDVRPSRAVAPRLGVCDGGRFRAGALFRHRGRGSWAHVRFHRERPRRDCLGLCFSGLRGAGAVPSGRGRRFEKYGHVFTAGSGPTLLVLCHRGRPRSGSIPSPFFRSAGEDGRVRSRGPDEPRAWVFNGEKSRTSVVRGRRDKSLHDHRPVRCRIFSESRLGLCFDGRGGAAALPSAHEARLETRGRIRRGGSDDSSQSSCRGRNSSPRVV
ncbi:hypothetical protein M885DRAFT_323435 [Pelagophyceae sp. CCMP2097]|nr:hypothetical protein M885DRAFT_323435 [Pelagophyceae sp. CCMP2097]